MKLTLAQARAVAKLTKEWQSAYDLQESLKTLGALATKGLADHHLEMLGSMFSPRTANSFRLKETKP